MLFRILLLLVLTQWAWPQEVATLNDGPIHRDFLVISREAGGVSLYIPPQNVSCAKVTIPVSQVPRLIWGLRKAREIAAARTYESVVIIRPGRGEVRVMTNGGTVLLSVRDDLQMLFVSYSPRNTVNEPDVTDKIVAALTKAAHMKKP